MCKFRANLRTIVKLMLIGTVVGRAGLCPASNFGAEVVSCVPAPGQFINHPSFNEPGDLLGPPSGGGTASADNSSVLSLGGFGGSVVIRFDHTVQDDARNYLGLDFIVFSNAYWSGNDRHRRWAEPAHVEIMRDVDGDGLPETCPEEKWYLIPGSLTTGGAAWRAQTWDNVTGSAYPPMNTSWFPQVGSYPYLPAGPSIIPLDANGRYATSAYELPASIYADPGGQSGTLGLLVNPNIGDEDPDNDGFETVYGYAELSPTLRLGDLDGDNLIDDPAADPAVFYTMPDNPWRVGVTPGSGGGDAFDIADAVDPETWQPANLAGFDFVRITGALDIVLGPLGEISAEIDAVADVRPVPCPGDVNGDRAVDLVDLLSLRNLIGIEDPDPAFVIPGDLRADGVHDLGDLAVLRAAHLGDVCE